MTAMQSAIGDYQIVARIGGGAMGGVYRAIYQPSGAEVAIKLLPPELMTDPIACGYFRRGAASASALRHPNILPTWHFGEHNGSPYLIMPLVRGGTLKERMERGAVPTAEALSYLRQLAAALDCAHAHGIVHRDVKPSNILLDERGQLYLADFGIARALAITTRYTRTGEGIGTPEYMAPEQARGRADERADLYAVGVIAYELLSGQLPFSGSTAIEILLRHLQDPLPLQPLRAAQPALPPAIEPVLLRALAKNPAARYPHATALVDALADALALRPAVPTWYAVGPTLPAATQQVAAPAAINHPRPQPAPPPRAARKPASLWLSASLAALLLLGSASGVGAWAVTRPDPTATASAQISATTAPPTSPVAAPVASAAATATATVATAPSPSAAATPSVTPPAPSATATAVAQTQQEPASVPYGWGVYSSAYLPLVVAYPPGWLVEEDRANKTVTFRSPTDKSLFVQLATTGIAEPGANVDVWRDIFYNALVEGCDASGVEDTFTATYTGHDFAALFATCQRQQALYGHYTGVTLCDDILWYYYTSSPYAAFDANAAAYFEPLLQSLNIYAAR